MNIQYIDKSHCQEDGCVDMYTDTKFGGKLFVFSVGEYDCGDFTERRLHD